MNENRAVMNEETSNSSPAPSPTSATAPNSNYEAFSRHTSSPSHKKKVRMLRYLTVIGVLAVYGVGVVANTGLGSLCAFGVSDIASICPVGILETAIAGRILLPLPLIVLLAIIALTVLFGRAFCGWVCPVPLSRKLITNKEERDAWAQDRKNAKDTCGCHPAGTSRKKPHFPLFSRNNYSALAVLAVTLITTVVFGFPVFCLVCPVGLVFATIFAIIRLAAFNELVVDIIVFPTLIVLELVLLRKWCSSFCPIGAFLGLFSRFNRVLVPKVNRSACLTTTHDAHCDLCHQACNFDIDLVRGAGSGVPADCSKCGECAAACPVEAISFRNTTS